MSKTAEMKHRTHYSTFGGIFFKHLTSCLPVFEKKLGTTMNHDLIFNKIV